MKRNCVILAVVLALTVVGCAQFQKVTDLICKPSEAQKADAAKMLLALDSVQAAVAILYPPAAIAKASAVLEVIKNGGCFLISELQTVFDMIDSAQEAKALKAGMKAPPRDTYPALRAVLRK